jgi:Reverse transcriptase (RNA-dependent DNA polymerase)
MVLVYVDNIIITSNNQIEIDHIKKNLKEKKLKINDLSNLKYFLGIEITCSTKWLFICQRKYTLDLLKKTDKIGCKPATTPIYSNLKLNIEDDEPLEDINQFQRLVTKIIYLTVTRSNLYFLMSQVSKFMHAPRTSYLDVINRILRYLKSTPEKRIYMRKKWY